MQLEIVTIRGHQNPPILQSLVHCLMPRPHFLLHCLLSTHSPNSFGTFNKLRCTTPIPSICLTPLTIFQHRHQSVFKNHFIIPNPGLVRPIPPANIPCFDAQTHLIPHPTLFKFVTPKRFGIAHGKPKVGAMQSFNTSPFFLSSKLIYCGRQVRQVVVDQNKKQEQKQLAHHKILQFSKWLDVWPHILVYSFGVFPPNSWESGVVGGVSMHKCECPEVMFKVGRRGEQIKLLHFVPRFDTNLCGHAKKTPMTQVFGGSWRKNAKCMPWMAHHLLPLPIWVNGSERRLRAIKKRSVWRRLILIYCSMSTTYHGVHTARYRGMTREEHKWWALRCQVESSGMDGVTVPVWVWDESPPP